MFRTLTSAALALQLLCSCSAAPPIAARGLRTPAAPCPASGDDPETPVFVPCLESCSQFYLCSHGVPYLLNCPAGLEFNAKTQQCDYPYNVNCSVVTTTATPETTTSPAVKTTSPAEPGSTTTSEPSSSTTRVSTTTTERTTSSAPVSSTESPNSSPATSAKTSAQTSTRVPLMASDVQGEADDLSCPEEGRYPVLLPNPRNCSTYYVCEHGVPQLMPCPRGLYFNNNTWTCDFPWNVNCSDLPTSTVSPSNSTTPAPISTTTSASSNATDTEQESYYLEVLSLLPEEHQSDVAAVSCLPEEGTFPVLLPNPRNCSTYYVCEHGVPQLMPCPRGLYFNNDTWTCDFPWNVDCNDLPTSTVSPSNSTTPTPSNATTSAPSNGTDVEHESFYLGVLSLLPDEQQEDLTTASCPPEDGAFPVFLPNPQNCSTFFECSHGIAILQVCPDNLFFNNNTWTCDFSFNVHCITVSDN